MRVIRNSIKVGAQKPFSFIHMSDTHFSMADERDDEQKILLSKNRTIWHPYAEKISSEVEAYAKQNNLMICHTGDYIDFVSESNLDRLKRFTDENDVFFAAGNHEFSLYVGEAFEDTAYREKSLYKVQACIKNNMRFSSRKINGVNLIAIDNGYYLYEQWQLDSLIHEAEYGLPMILFMHTPLYDEKIMEIVIGQNSHYEAAYMVGAPEEIMSDYSEYRYRQQKADAITLKTVEYIKSQPLIKAIFCGHFHEFASETKLTDNITQYISNFDNIRLVHID